MSKIINISLLLVTVLTISGCYDNRTPGERLDDSIQNEADRIAGICVAREYNTGENAYKCIDKLIGNK